MKPNQKGLAPIVIVLAAIAILAIGGAGAWYFTQTVKPKSAPAVSQQTGRPATTDQRNSQTQNTPENSAAVQPQPIDQADIAGWKTYRNEKYGFEFKYPGDLTDNTNSFGGTLAFASTKSIVINVSNDPKTEHCVYPLAHIGKDSQAVINGIAFRKQIGETSGSNGAPLYQVNSYSTMNNGSCVILSLINNTGSIDNASTGLKSGQDTTIASDDLSAMPEGKIFGQMLSTFKFTEVVDNYDSLFSQYKISEVFNGISAPLDLNSDPEAMNFKTRLTAAYKSVPNFAGHYNFEFWGCGSSCQRAAVIDHNTGRVYFLAEMAAAGFEVKNNSNLIVLNPTHETQETCDIKRLAACYPAKFYLWENNKFRQVPVEGN
jgi:hypothetical protein